LRDAIAKQYNFLLFLPSVLPTSVPTTSHSLSCHYVASYRSPLNLFRCSDHMGTDCFQWRVLGLKPGEVEELINNCPITCGIECGSLFNFDVALTYRLVNVDNFLAPDSTTTMETASAEYLTSFILPKATLSRFSLYRVELLSQKLVQQPRIRRRLQVEQDDVNLEVSVAFRGFAINLSYETVEEYLLDGIYSFGYMRALKYTGDPSFENVQIASITQDNSTPNDAPETEAASTESSSKVIAASVIAGLAVVALGGGYIIYKERHQRRYGPTTKESELDSRVNSPAGSTRSPLANVLSFESVVRLMSSGSPRSNSSTSAGATSGHSLSTEGKSSDCNSSPESIEAAHPLTGVIPPMLVYNCIDEEENKVETTTRERTKVKDVVPTKHLEATPNFLEALNGKRGITLDETTYAGILQSSSSVVENAQPLEPQIYSRASLNFADKYHNETARLGKPLGVTEVTNLGMPADKSNTAVLATKKRRSIVWPRGRKQPDHPSCANQLLSSGSSLRKPSLERDTSGASTVKAGRTSSDVYAAPTPAYQEQDNDSSGSFIQSLMKLSPRKIRKLSPPHQSSSPVPASEKMPQPGRMFKQRSNCSEPSKGETSLTLTATGSQLVFQAPRKGKLGLVIRCPDSRGPIVVEVKDYSPLLGQVLPGDRILDIDGHPTAGMKLKDVTGIMGGKVSQASRWVSVFRIVIWRSFVQQEKDELLRLLDGEHSSLAQHDSGLLLSDCPAPKSTGSKDDWMSSESQSPLRKRADSGGSTRSDPRIRRTTTSPIRRSNSASSRIGQNR